MSEQQDNVGADRAGAGRDDEERVAREAGSGRDATGGTVAPEGSGKQFAGDEQTHVHEVGNPADPDSGKGFAQGQADLRDEPGLPNHPRQD